jgi:hypothetical protein
MTFITHGFRVSVVSDVRERVRDDSALKKSRSRYISAQNISTLFDALDEREIARLFSDSRTFMAVAVSYYFEVKFSMKMHVTTKSTAESSLIQSNCRSLRNLKS